ncbi:MAG TPA: phosphoribosyltransferase family protein [Egibacteraceae bacterium]
MQVFEDRQDAGRQLARALASDPDIASADRVVVLGIPRGGLPVGAEVARALGAEFDVSVVRKLRAPQNPELGYGAVGPDGRVQLDEQLVARLGLTEEQVEAEIADRRAAVERRLAMFREVIPPVDLTGATVIVVDDGIATGGTARQACAFARAAGAARVILAVPVAPPGAAEELADAADRVLVLSQPAEFLAVGQAYRDFSQLTDEAALAAVRSATAAS